MTERCQRRFTEKFDHQINIVYVGAIIGSLAVLYFYRFHFATIAFSYVLGCVACYYGLKSHILHKYVEQLKCHFVKNPRIIELQDDPVKVCETCGSTKCSRHDSSITAEPWVGLQIHKQLDQAIEDFYNAILDQFINTWYNRVTLQPFFVDELRHQLRYASACLLRRAIKINYSRFITERLVPCALRHYTLCACGDGPPEGKLSIHPAAASRRAELRYLRAITNAIMPYLLKNNELQNSVFRVLIREIFAGWVLLSLTDVLADPHILNTLIVLATGNETMAQLPTSPNYKVEFLETFVRHTDSVYAQRAKLLHIDLDLVINDQEYFYAFMQFIKTTSHIHLLQFYKDINFSVAAE
ncbi:sorting nexin-14-like [Hyposmocoma kahamanoa]|uniref:sorting nexin-14-like n=1 Tax=Hyposmocoma kahamanoa TaxID=1477025 RepID=UPI000E6D6340|nr:sorting nexin-14-like [Hyposmocoma kahamanoa]